MCSEQELRIPEESRPVEETAEVKTEIINELIISNPSPILEEEKSQNLNLEVQKKDEQNEIILPTVEEMRAGLRLFLTSENAFEFTKGSARSKLESVLNLPPNSLQKIKQECFECVQDVMAEFLQQNINSEIIKKEEINNNLESENKNKSEKRKRIQNENEIENDISSIDDFKNKNKNKRQRKISDDEINEDEINNNNNLNEDENEEDEETISSHSKNKKNKSKLTPNKKPPGAKKLQMNLMTKSDFLTSAPQFGVQMSPQDISFDLKPRIFSTGSCGWFYGAKHQIQVGDKLVTCQLTFNCTVVGSKTWKDSKSSRRRHSSDDDSE